MGMVRFGIFFIGLGVEYHEGREQMHEHPGFERNYVGIIEGNDENGHRAGVDG